MFTIQTRGTSGKYRPFPLDAATSASAAGSREKALSLNQDGYDVELSYQPSPRHHVYLILSTKRGIMPSLESIIGTIACI